MDQVKAIEEALKTYGTENVLGVSARWSARRLVDIELIDSLMQITVGNEYILSTPPPFSLQLELTPHGRPTIRRPEHRHSNTNNPHSNPRDERYRPRLETGQDVAPRDE